VDRRTIKAIVSDLRQFRGDYSSITIPTEEGPFTVAFQPVEKPLQNPRDIQKPVRLPTAIDGLSLVPPADILAEAK